MNTIGDINSILTEMFYADDGTLMFRAPIKVDWYTMTSFGNSLADKNYT